MNIPVPGSFAIRNQCKPPVRMLDERMALMHQVKFRCSTARGLTRTRSIVPRGLRGLCFV